MVTSNGKGNPIKTFESQMQFLQNHATEVTLVLDCSLTINSFHKKPNSIRSLYTNLNLVKRLFNNGTCQFFKSLIQRCQLLEIKCGWNMNTGRQPASHSSGENPESFCYLAQVLHWKVLFGDPTQEWSKLFPFSDSTYKSPSYAQLLACIAISHFSFTDNQWSSNDYPLYFWLYHSKTGEF